MSLGLWAALLVALSGPVGKMHDLYDHFYGTLKKINLLLVLYLQLIIFLLPAVGMQKEMYFRDGSDGKS